MENPDFKGLGWLLALSLICTVPVPQAMLELLYVPWDELMAIKDSNYYSRAQSNLGAIILFFFFFIPLIYKTSSNCQQRIKDGKVTAKQGWKEYAVSMFLYLFFVFTIASILFLIGAPLMTLRRDLVPHDARPM